MEKNIKENYIEYLDYLRSKLLEVDSKTSKMILMNLNKFSKIDHNDIKETYRMLEFLEKVEGKKIFAYHEWFKYIKIIK